MSAPERDLKEWEFRVLGRVLVRLPRHIAYLIILGLSIGFGLRSPDEARLIAGGAVQKILLELHELRVIIVGLTRRIAPAGKRRLSPAPPRPPRERWTEAPSGQEPASRFVPETGQSVRRSARTPSATCYADAERLHGNSLRLREAPCSTSVLRRLVAPGSGAIGLTGRHSYCRRRGVWWTWVEVLDRDGPLWVARYYLRCFGEGVPGDIRRDPPMPRALPN
jgi:hypothetical protein